MFTRATADPKQMAAWIKAVTTLGGTLVHMEFDGPWNDVRGNIVPQGRAAVLRGSGFYVEWRSGKSSKAYPHSTPSWFSGTPVVRATFMLDTER